VTSETFRLAAVLGVASIPVTVVLNWPLTPASLPRSSDPSALLLACVFAGYCYESRSAASTRAGAITGCVGGLPIVLWQSAIGFVDVWGHPVVVTAVGESVLMAVVAAGTAFVSAAVLVGVVWLLGSVGGGLGWWLNGRLTASRLLGPTS